MKDKYITISENILADTGLSCAEKLVLGLIDHWRRYYNYKVEFNCSDTYICDYLGMSSCRAVNRHLQQLENKGYIKRHVITYKDHEKGLVRKRRTIEVL